MDQEQDNAALAAEEDAAFASGFTDKAPPGKAAPAAGDAKPGKADTPAPAKAEGKAPAPAAPVEKPEYVQITKKDWEEVSAAARRSASYDQQFSKAFGTLGNLQKQVEGFKGAAAAGGRKFEIPKDAFAEMERDFPELAQMSRGALEKAFANYIGPGSGDAAMDEAKIDALIAAREEKKELRTLEDDFPEWRKIVGAVNVAAGEQPDPKNPYRAWLGTKDVAYQNRINTSTTASVIAGSIRAFQEETRQKHPGAGGGTRDNGRADRIRGALQPRGDNGGAGAARTDDDDFLEGFSSR